MTIIKITRIKVFTHEGIEATATIKLYINKKSCSVLAEINQIDRWRKSAWAWDSYLKDAGMLDDLERWRLIYLDSDKCFLISSAYIEVRCIPAMAALKLIELVTDYWQDASVAIDFHQCMEDE